MREKRREDIWINNRSLRDVDARIINVRLLEDRAERETIFGDWPGRPGRLLLGARRVSKTVRIEFGIRELYDLAAREAVLEAVNAWAADGVLTASARPGRMLEGVVKAWAAAEDIRDYNAAYQLEFETTAVPFWQDELPATVSGSGATGEISLTVGGDLPTWAEITMTAGAALSSATITTASAEGQTATALSGLSLAAGKVLRIYHDAAGILRIEADGVSALSKRGAASADEPLIGPGLSKITWSANASVTVNVSARGRYR